MKILFVWTGVTSYMADCWRVLARQPGVELRVVVEKVGSGSGFDAAQVMRGLDCELVTEDDLPRLAKELWGAYSPDIVFAVGWHSKVVRAAVTCPQWKDVPKVCCFDLPWRWKLRCIAARFVLGPFLRHYAAAYVPGRACATYARWLGFRTVHKGLFSIDMSRFVRPEMRGKGFLYVGRFSDEKNLDTLVEAYRRYRREGGRWTLDLYGAGALPRAYQADPRSYDGVSVHPFAQPDEMPRIYAEHGCLLLASAFDPWPLVALEAKAVGCEVIQSDRCGNRHELETRVTRYGDAAALAQEMLRVERGEANRRKPDGARPLTTWDCRTWACRTLEICKKERIA